MTTENDITIPAEWQDLAAELRQVFVEGEEALTTQRQSLDRVFRIGKAFAGLQQEAMRRSHSNNPIGKRYNEAFARLTHPTPELTKVNKTDRSQYMWCYQYRDLIEGWWQTVAVNQRDRWGHPDTIKKQYLKAHGDPAAEADASPAKPKPEPKPGIRDEVARLQQELDEAQRQLRARVGGIDWSRSEEALVAEFMIAAESDLAGKVLRVTQTTADRLRRGQKTGQSPKVELNKSTAPKVRRGVRQ